MLKYFRKQNYPFLQRHKQSFFSKQLRRDVLLDIYKPKSRRETPQFTFLIINDGQDLQKISLSKIWRKVQHKTSPIIFIGIHNNQRRRQELGTTTPDSNKLGQDAKRYQKFIVLELIPFLTQNYGNPQKTFIAGFSLGALSAMDTLLNYPNSFDGVGAFSGAFWWRSQSMIPSQPDAFLIIPRKIYSSNLIHQKLYWFSAGNQEEKNDRNNNGIIDVIDDTKMVISALAQKGVAAKKIMYLELIGEKHDLNNWARALPHFLVWAIRKR